MTLWLFFNNFPQIKIYQSRMTSLLNIISVIATFIVAEGIVFFILNTFFGRIKVLNKSLLYSLTFKHLIFYSFGLLLLLIFTNFYKPWWMPFLKSNSPGIITKLSQSLSSACLSKPEHIWFTDFPQQGQWFADGGPSILLTLLLLRF